MPSEDVVLHAERCAIPHRGIKSVRRALLTVSLYWSKQGKASSHPQSQHTMVSRYFVPMYCVSSGKSIIQWRPDPFVLHCARNKWGTSNRRPAPCICFIIIVIPSWSQMSLCKWGDGVQKLWLLNTRIVVKRVNNRSCGMPSLTKAVVLHLDSSTKVESCCMSLKVHYFFCLSFSFGCFLCFSVC